MVEIRKWALVGFMLSLFLFYCFSSNLLSALIVPEDTRVFSLQGSIHTNKSKYKLEFVHITKTAGTSIERMAAHAGIAWGACKFIRYSHCNILPPSMPQVEKAEWNCNHPDILPWHCPPMKFQSGLNLYNNSATFVIVRNPYDRITSEYYWTRMGYDRVSLETANNEEEFNKWINNKLDKVLEYGFFFDGHGIPMHKYTHHNGKQIIDHILHLENITRELPSLMEEYDLNVILPRENSREEGAILGVENMTNATISKVNYWAHLDFALFGYKMIVPDFPIEERVARNDSLPRPSPSTPIVSTYAEKKKHLPEPKLQFVHVTKTAGTSIEQMAAQSGIAWGACKFIRYSHCNSLPPTVPQFDQDKWKCKHPKIVPWHCPPMQFKSGINMYNNYSTFAVVRNPYDRITSEYYWKRMEVDHVDLETANNEDEFNAWINGALRKAYMNGFYFDGHCIPMNMYTHHQGKQVVDHILHFEKLSAELPALMKKYDLNITMPRLNARKEGAQLGVRNMTDATIYKINFWARLDFALFGYDMINPI